MRAGNDASPPLTLALPWLGPMKWLASRAAVAVAVIAAGCGAGQGAMSDAKRPPPGSPGERNPPGSSAERPAIEVAPETPRPRDSIRITFATPYVIGDMTRNGKRAGEQDVGPSTAQSYDNYHVIFSGPGGRACKSVLHFALGYLTERRRIATRTVVIKRPGRQAPRRVNTNWCPGRYAGHVEYRQPDRSPGIPAERLGTFSFAVEAR